ncbi:MAG: hypothetical protein KJ072_04945 [Verrucomicrobia bacterium]|nr:hypothetical protein [Verrucomicrobiota bacterium]
MNDFDRKWQACATRARQAPGSDEPVPLGFTTRVLARAWPTPGSVASLEQIWQRLTWRSLAVTGVFLAVCAVLELPHLRDAKPLEPGIENAVAQLVWRL